jgi:hypothetical protein
VRAIPAAPAPGIERAAGAAVTDDDPTNHTPATRVRSEKENRMKNRWSMLLLLLVGVLGWRLSSTVEAQNTVRPFDVGDTITLTYADNGTYHDCQVAEVRGIFLRCEAPARSQSREYWINFSTLKGFDVKRTR